MEVLNPQLSLDRFFAELREAPERILFLDYDGTLAPFHVSPEHAVPYPGVADVVRHIARRCATRVIVVTGRCVADLRSPLDAVCHDEVWGSHGWQRRLSDGPAVEFEPPDEARELLVQAEARARTVAGARIERKVASVAVHWRGMHREAAHAVRQGIFEAWQGFDSGALDLLDFSGGVELRARGRNKGDAVREVLATCAPDAVCAYLGDDVTDEDAFAAIAHRGLAVLVRPQLRETCAHLWVRPPVGLLTFLQRWRSSARSP